MPAPPSASELPRFVDLTLLRPDATSQDVEQLCRRAQDHRIYGVCVHGSRVERARILLEETDVKIICAVGFPLGANASDAKRFEAEAAVDDGAHEIDLVPNVGLLKDGDDRAVLRELRDVVEATDERPVKVMLPSALLSRDEMIRACQLADESGAQFVGALTDSNPAAAVEVTKLLRGSIRTKLGLKVAGAFADAKAAAALIEAGATRLGLTADGFLVPPS